MNLDIEFVGVNVLFDIVRIMGEMVVRKIELDGCFDLIDGLGKKKKRKVESFVWKLLGFFVVCE